jgi:Tol biopolymer transport system component/DNA-binding CsgD family transcriptional regulator
MLRRHPPNELTPREREVFELLRRGLTNEEIAWRIEVSVAGAKYHVSQILSKFGVGTREQAAACLQERQPWLRKLVLVGATGAVATALAGIALPAFDRGTKVTDEPGVYANESVTPPAIYPPIDETAPNTATPSPSPPADVGESIRATSPLTVVGPVGVPPPAPSRIPTKTPPATAVGSATPTPTPTDAENGVPGRNGRIAFVSGTTNGWEIHSMAHDGSGRTSMISGPEAYYPAWSPDGTKIAFQGTTSGFGSSDIFVANADGSGVTNLTNNPGPNYSPAWSPDGSRIAFSKDNDLWVMNADGSGAMMIFGASDSYDFSPSWSPDGSKIAFYVIRAGSLGGPGIFTVNADGTRLARLTFGGLIPAWSPDGTRIAFTSHDSGRNEIHVMNADGSNQVQLTDKGGHSPTWSPDGGTIAFVRARPYSPTGDTEIYSMGVDGTNQFNLTNSASLEFSPAWQPLLPTPEPTEPPAPSPTDTPAPTQSIAAFFPIQAVTDDGAVLRPAAHRVRQRWQQRLQQLEHLSAPGDRKHNSVSVQGGSDEDTDPRPPHSTRPTGRGG